MKDTPFLLRYIPPRARDKNLNGQNRHIKGKQAGSDVSILRCDKSRQDHKLKTFIFTSKKNSVKGRLRRVVNKSHIYILKYL